MKAIAQVQRDVKLQAYCLLELGRLSGKSKEYHSQANRDPVLSKALQRAVYSAFRDCQDLGLDSAAVEVLHG